MDKILINIRQLSDLIDVRVNTIYCWASQRRIPFVKLGRLTRFDLQRTGTWISGSGTEKRILEGQTRPTKPIQVTLAAK